MATKFRAGKCQVCGRAARIFDVFRWGQQITDEQVEAHSWIDPDSDEIGLCPGSWKQPA